MLGGWARAAMAIGGGRRRRKTPNGVRRPSVWWPRANGSRPNQSAPTRRPCSPPTRRGEQGDGKMTKQCRKNNEAVPHEIAGLPL